MTALCLYFNFFLSSLISRCLHVKSAGVSPVGRCCVRWQLVLRLSVLTRSMSQINAVPSVRVVSVGFCYLHQCCTETFFFFVLFYKTKTFFVATARYHWHKRAKCKNAFAQGHLSRSYSVMQKNAGSCNAVFAEPSNERLHDGSSEVCFH